MPAISTCPGRSALCEDLCYGQKGLYFMPNVVEALALRMELRRETRFVEAIVAQIKAERIRTVRIHAVGDFDYVWYVRAWAKIAQASRGTIFCVYTRSWRVARLQPELKKLAKIRNLRVWLSCDRETGAPPRWRGTRRAYMQIDDADIPAFWVDLVFRTDYHHSVIKYVNGALVCCVENGVTKGVTCDVCKLCYLNKPIIRKDRVHASRVEGHHSLSLPQPRNDGVLSGVVDQR